MNLNNIDVENVENVEPSAPPKYEDLITNNPFNKT